jgi:DNA polymerase III subunit alpha
MHAVAEFFHQAENTGVKLIIGIEAYLAPGSRRRKGPVLWGQANQWGSDE